MFHSLVMTRISAHVLFFLGVAFFLSAEPEVPAEAPNLFYETLEVKESRLGDFSMLAQERDDYATTLARFAIESAHLEPANKDNMSGVRRFIAFALHLSPRNRTAVVSNHQFGRGLMPEHKEADYSRTVFARLLLTRGRLLKRQKSEADQFVGRCFIELAAELDPRNEEAVYDSEIQKLDEQEVDWSLFMGKEETAEGE